jgi:uncharacterized membrane protein
MTTAAGPRPGLAVLRGEGKEAARRRRFGHGRGRGHAAEAESGQGTLWTWGLAAGLFVLYCAVAIREHVLLRTSGFDLGIFEQAVRSYAHGHLPVAEIKGPDFRLLGDHFSPVLAVLAPLYRLFPTPVTLLVAQAALLAVAVVPLAGWAQRALGRRAAIVIGLGYGLSWGIAQTIGFDFHEVAFAVPLLAFSAAALGEGRFTAAVLWALPLLTVKEDLGLTVAVVGGLVAWGGQRALGLATAAVGVAGSALAVLVILPANNAAGTFAYWSKFHETNPDAPKHGLSDLLHRATVGWITPEPKATMLILLLAPTAMLALRSRLLLLVVPTLAWRLVSLNPDYWGTAFHYSAVLMPVVFAAFIDALRRRAEAEQSARAAGVRLTGVREALLASSLVTALLLPQFPLWTVVHKAEWKAEPRATAAHRLMDRIPDGVRVAASNRLAPHLTNRTEVTIFGYSEDRPSPDWIIVDQDGPLNWPFPSLRSQHKYVTEVIAAGYVKVADEDHYLLLRKPSRPD